MVNVYPLQRQGSVGSSTGGAAGPTADKKKLVKRQKRLLGSILGPAFEPQRTVNKDLSIIYEEGFAAALSASAADSGSASTLDQRGAAVNALASARMASIASIASIDLG